MFNDDSGTFYIFHTKFRIRLIINCLDNWFTLRAGAHCLVVIIVVIIYYNQVSVRTCVAMAPRPPGVGGGVASTENIGNIFTLKAWRARECCGVTYGGWREGGSGGSSSLELVGRRETGGEMSQHSGLQHRSVIVQCVAALLGRECWSSSSLLAHHQDKSGQCGQIDFNITLSINYPLDIHLKTAHPQLLQKQYGCWSSIECGTRKSWYVMCLTYRKMKTFIFVRFIWDIFS